MLKNNFFLNYDWQHRVSILDAECLKIQKMLGTLLETDWPKDEHDNVSKEYHNKIAGRIFALENECEKLACMARWQTAFSVADVQQNRASLLVEDAVSANFEVEIDDVDSEKRILRLPCLLPKRNTKTAEYFPSSLHAALKKLSFDEFKNGPFLIEFTSVYPKKYPYDCRKNTTPEIAAVVERLFFDQVVECTDETNYSLLLSTRREQCEKPYAEIIITRKK